MKLTVQDVEHIATLARLSLSHKEKEQYAEELSVIFDYVEMLNEVDVDGVIETSQVTGLENVVRPDRVEDCDEDVRKRLVQAFPKRLGALLQVQGVFSVQDEEDL